MYFFQLAGSNFRFVLLGNMAARAKNNVDDKYVSKLLRAHGVTDDEAKFSVSDLDVVAENYGEFLQELVTHCQRPTKLVFQGALKLAFQGINPQKAELMAQRLSACCSYCRSKASHSTSGVKLNTVVRSIGLLLLGKTDSLSGVQLGAGRLGASLMQTARKLHRSKCDEVAPSPKRAKSSLSIGSSRDKSSQECFDSIDELKNLYGLKSESLVTVRKAAMIEQGPIDLDPSSEDEIAFVTATATTKLSFQILTDHSSGRLYKMNSVTGERVFATMAKGPAGFQKATFADDPAVELDTEIPNLLLDAQPKKTMKKPAAAPQKKTPLKELEAEVEKEAKLEKIPPVEEEESPDEEDEEEEEEEEEAEADDVSVASTRGYDEQGIDRSSVPKFESAKMKKPVKSDGSGQSYITGPAKGSGSEKAVLIVAVTATMASRKGLNHKDVIDKIFDKLKAKVTFDKAHALKIRSELLS